MFTGIIECLAKVDRIERLGRAARLMIDMGHLAEKVKPGDSIAVNGACLTATDVSGKDVGFDLSEETLVRTTLGGLRPSDRVNIERALRLGDSLGGHLVSGHVDGVGTITARVDTGEQCTMWIELPLRLRDEIIQKGSVAVDGISLTVVDITGSSFSVVLIPYTLKMTTLGLRRNGDKVNIETDMLGKWVKKLLSAWLAKEKPGEGITPEMLRAQGFD